MAMMAWSRRGVLGGLALAPLAARAQAQAAVPWSTTSVASKTDGARIVYHVAGKGPPLVMVHGGSTTSAAYRTFAGYLVDRFRVALLDRRNYTVSQATGSPHTFQQEVGDVAAVIQQLGAPAFLFGHSAGALVSLHVARSEPRLLRALAVYEPPLSGGGPQVKEVLARVDPLIASGREDEAMAFLYQHFVGLEPAVARALIAARGAQLRPLLSGSRLDLEALVTLETDPQRWRGITTSTLLLVGDKSVEHPLRDSTAQLAAVLPDSRTVTLPGQGHAAYAEAPELLAREVGAFFTAQVGGERG